MNQKIISMKRSIRCSINSLKSRMRFQTTVCIWQMDFVKVMDILRTEEIETIRNAEHTGILLLFEFPQSVDLEINEEKIYAIVWEYLMKLQEELPRALMYYGKRDEHGIEKHTSKLGIFLPFCHFEREMEKNIELANGIGLGCRETILAEMKVLEK